MKLDKKKIIKILIIISLILFGIVIYTLIINPSIQDIKVKAHRQGVIDVIGYINNQIQVNGWSEINLEERVILCQYGK